MRKSALWVLGLAVLLPLCSCHRTPVEAVQIHRFDKVLFETPASQLQGKLASVAGEFNTPLLNLQPENPEFMQMLAGFVSDSTMREVYRLVDSVFGDMQPQSQQLGEALHKVEQLCPSCRYDRVYTFVSGMFDYNMRVGCNSHELIISLDQYVLPYLSKYNYFNTPLFLVQQSRPEYLVADCITAIARDHIAIPQDRDMSLLDYMISEGKAIYFAQQVLPDAPDSIQERIQRVELLHAEPTALRGGLHALPQPHRRRPQDQRLQRLLAPHHRLYRMADSEKLYEEQQGHHGGAL